MHWIDGDDRQRCQWNYRCQNLYDCRSGQHFSSGTEFPEKMCRMILAGDYWYFQGFDVTGSVNSLKGIQVSGSHNTLDDIMAYRNGNTGFRSAVTRAQTEEATGLPIT